MHEDGNKVRKEATVFDDDDDNKEEKK